MLQSTLPTPFSRLDLSLAIWGLALLTLAPAVRADLFPCTQGGILDAIDMATGPGPHTFDCPPGTTITTEAEILIQHDVILDGEGNLTLDAAGGHRVLSVGVDPTVELRNLTLSGGNAGDPQPDTDGGGILNEGTLTLRNVTVFGNRADRGGGIHNEAMATLVLVNTTVSENSGLLGGGIWSDGIAELVNSKVSGNTAVVSGGGLYTFQSSDTELVNSTASGNMASDSGAGVSNAAMLMLVGSTVSGNTGAFAGGGIKNFSTGTLILLNSTVSGNQATFGGAVWNQGMVALTHATLAANTADEGISIWDSIGNGLRFANTLIDGDCLFFDTAVTSDGGNLESPGNSCSLTDFTDQVNVTPADLALLPLDDNWGPTETHALLPGSFAIDAAVPANCLPKDQRGVPRPEPGGTYCDIGAFEVVPEPGLAAMATWGVASLCALSRRKST